MIHWIFVLFGLVLVALITAKITSLVGASTRRVEHIYHRSNDDGDGVGCIVLLIAVAVIVAVFAQ